MTIELSWLLAIVPFLTAGAGAYLGSYLKKKGENLATHEDIDKVLDDVRAVTATTKQIEAKISNDVWDRQKRWELKRDAVFEVTRKIGLAYVALNDMYAIYHANKQSKTTDPERLSLAARRYQEWNCAANDLESSIMLLDLVCGTVVADEARRFSIFGRRTAGAIAEGRPEALMESTQELVARLKAVTVAIRSEMENPK